MKKNLLVLILILSLFTLTACNNQSKGKQTSEDAIKFKEEYEKLNGTTRQKDGKTIRTIEIPENNPFVYSEAKDMIELMEDKKSFVVYFGFADCPWCRSMLPNLIKVVEELEIDTVYYVDVKEIRDTMKLDENGTPIVDQKGTDGYYDLLEAFDPVLEEYTLTDQNGNKINTGEKRIYAPNIVAVVDGVAVEITDGISEQQTDGYMELTNEIQEESYNKIKCTIQCVADNKKTCSAKSSC